MSGALGIAYGTSPFYNNVWRQFSFPILRPTACNENGPRPSSKFQRFAHTATDVENALDVCRSGSLKPHGVDGPDLMRG
jgi:hypothetical protein